MGGYTYYILYILSHGRFLGTHGFPRLCHKSNFIPLKTQKKLQINITEVHQCILDLRCPLKSIKTYGKAAKEDEKSYLNNSTRFYNKQKHLIAVWVPISISGTLNIIRFLGVCRYIILSNNIV